MTHDFTGPHPDKRLDDMQALVQGYIAAQNEMDAERYPDSIEGGWQSHELADALEGLLDRAMWPLKRAFGEVTYSFESVAKGQAVQKATAVILAAVEGGITPSVEDHRLVVATLAQNWPFGFHVSFDHMEHCHWPSQVIPVGDHLFEAQTPEAEEAWQSRIERREARRQEAAKREVDRINLAMSQMGWVAPATCEVSPSP